MEILASILLNVLYFSRPPLAIMSDCRTPKTQPLRSTPPSLIPLSLPLPVDLILVLRVPPTRFNCHLVTDLNVPIRDANQSALVTDQPSCDVRISSRPINIRK